MHPALRSFLAVIAAFFAMSFTIGVLTVIAGRGAAGSLWLHVVFSFLAAGVGGFVAGLVASSRPVEHGAIFGVLLLVTGAIAYARLQVVQPGWYSLLLVLGPPACAVGGAALCAVSAKRAAQ